MELRPIFALILGGALLVSLQVLNLFGLFRSVDWLRISAPAVFSTLGVLGATLVIAGFGMCAWGLYETSKRKGLSSDKPEPDIAYSRPAEEERREHARHANLWMERA